MKFVVDRPAIRASKYYKVRVHAINCSLKSEGSTIVVTSGSRPEAPSAAPYVLSYDSTEAMTIKWQSTSYNGGFPITSVKLYVDNQELIELNQSVNFFQMTGLTLGNSYKVQVTAINEIGESDFSPANTVVFANVPDAPAQLTLTPTYAEPSTIMIQWAEPAQVNGDDVDGYKVYIDNGRGGPFELILDATGFPSRYSYTAGEHEQLDCGYLYMVRVTATNVAGEGSHIASSVHLGNVPSNPKSPAMEAVVPQSALVVSWQRPDSDGCLPLTHYVLNKDGVDLPDLIAPSATSFTDDISTGGAIGTQITYKIKALNVNGESGYSEDLKVTVGLVPSKPQNLQRIQMLSEDTIQVSWEPGLAISDNPATLSYRVYLDDASGNEAQIVWDSEGQALSNIATLAGLRTGSVYSATVTAINEIGESSASDPLTIYTGIAPSKITYLVWESSTTTSVTFRWALPEFNGGLSLQKFKLYIDVGKTGQPPKVVEILDIFQRSYTESNLSTSTLVDV